MPIMDNFQKKLRAKINADLYIYMSEMDKIGM